MPTITTDTVKMRLEKLNSLIQEIQRSGRHQLDDGSGFTLTHQLYSLVHFALNCPIYKTTYYVLMEYCALLIRAFPHKDAFTFNFYEREEDKAAQDYTQDLK